MRCPNCGHTNNLNRDQCQNCGAQVAYLRERVFIGRQFVFFEASKEQPIVVALTPAGTPEGQEHRLSKPTIISRHEHGIHLGAVPSDELDQPRFRLWGRRRDPINVREHLPALDFPTLDLTTVVTDRKIYRPGDEVYIFVVALNAADQPAELEVKLAGQRVYHTRLTLNESGLHLARFAELEEGEYSVSVTLPDGSMGRAECTFSCAEFTLSPLIAKLDSHTLERDRLSVVLKLTQLGVPYSGPLELALRSGGRVVSKKEGQATDGALTADFDLGQAWEALTIEVTTPEGNTATLALPSTGWRERERISLCPLDPPVEASLLPFPRAEGTIRGLHYAQGREVDTPFALQSVVAAEGCIQARRDAELVHIVLFNPLSGGHRSLEFRGVKTGDVLSFEVDSPYVVFTLGALMGGQVLPYEAWGLVVRPVELEATLDVPGEAVPGATLSARVETDRPALCLLLVYDARLEHEDPLPRLAQRIFHHIRDGTKTLGAQRLQAVAQAPWEQMFDWDDWEFGPPGMVRAAGPTVLYAAAPAPAKAVLDEVAVEEAPPEAVLTMLVAPREDFPELAHIELFSVDGSVDKLFQLGDQIGNWRCRAYFFRDLNYVSVTQEIRAALDLYAELDLPAIVGEGDEILAQARYHALGEARLQVTTPTERVEYTVDGDGMVEFPLTAPGQVSAHIASGTGSDTSQRTVDAPGQETVTASRLALLRRGETVSGVRVVVFPSMGPLLQETIEALIHYPFG